MAISHIPRSVGHNSLPEYQISSVPYVRVTKLDDRTRHVIRKSDGLEVGTLVLGSTDVTTNGKIPDIEIFKDGNSNNSIDASEKVSTNFKEDGSSVDLFKVVSKVKFPKITSWIQFKTAAAGLKVYFSFIDAANDRNYITIGANSDSFVLRLRCANLYITDGATNNATIIAGLTTIDHSQFDKVIEKFLGDNIS
tara:strand:- start:422 stop:1003 length:582 start_codon:yes stop_codon:yes gene_type:complete